MTMAALSATATAMPAQATKTVLEEDAYTDALAAIIERDFFPQLTRLRAQEEYLDVRAQ
jgi:protein DGCR14